MVKELEEKDNEQLTLSKTIAELNQKLVEKENKMNIVSKSLILIEEKRKKDDEEIQRLHCVIGKLSLENNELVKDGKQKIDTQINLAAKYREAIS